MIYFKLGLAASAVVLLGVACGGDPASVDEQECDIALGEESAGKAQQQLETVQQVCQSASPIELDPSGSFVGSFPFIEGEGFRSVRGTDAAAGGAFTFEVTEERSVSWTIRSNVPVGFFLYTYEEEAPDLCDGHFGGSVSTTVPINGVYEVNSGDSEAPLAPGKYTVIVSSADEASPCTHFDVDLHW